MKTFSALVAALLLAAAVCAPAQQTTRKRLAPAGRTTSADAGATVAACDTVAAPEPHMVDINGYDKPLRSRRETFFVTNNAEAPVTALAFTITYYDQARRMLHKASHHVPVSVPPGETRQVSIRSWDTQQSFYHVRSTPPRGTVQASPYDVTISVDTVFVAR